MVKTASRNLLYLLNANYFVEICFAVFALTRLSLLVLLHIEPASDASWYHARAIDIDDGLGYQESGYPTAFWPVGWPAALAMFYMLAGANPINGCIANLLFA